MNDSLYIYNLSVTPKSIPDLCQISKEIRREIITFSHKHQLAHLASNLSVVEIITALFFHSMRNFEKATYSTKSDQFILSKGHAAVALYFALYKKDFISESDIKSFGKPGSSFEEHPNQKIPTVLTATGSLGHGLAFANGFALANKKNNINSRIYILMSDGECNEGTVWESAIFTKAKGLGNITAIIDHNKFQATGPINESLGNISISEVFSAFGWISFEIDGHSIDELVDVLNRNQNSTNPVAIICNTIKGKGVSFMENDNNWHYKSPNEEELIMAMEEINRA